MSNSRYTLQVETNDDNLMFFWRTHLNHNLPFDVNFRAGDFPGPPQLRMSGRPRRRCRRVESAHLMCTLSVGCAIHPLGLISPTCQIAQWGWIKASRLWDNFLRSLISP